MAMGPETGGGALSQVRPAADTTPRRTYAALDLGTNNCRMLIARPNGAGLGILDSVSRTVSLGMDLERTGALSDAGINRVMRTLHLCAARLRRHDVRRMSLVATAACRQARNGSDLVAAIRRETGLALEIIPPELEARLALTSCAPLVSEEAGELLVFDIGGGSTELIWIDLSSVEPGRRRRAVLELAPLRGRLAPEGPLGARIVDWISVPLGVATLHQRYGDVEEDLARFALMSWCFEEMMEGFRPAVAVRPPAGLQVIGTSGTVTTIAAVILRLPRYMRERVDGVWLDRTGVTAVIDRIVAQPIEARSRHPAIGPQRALLILAGMAILQALLRLWPVSRLRVADRGLREGLLYAMMHEDGHFPAEDA